MYIFFTYIFCLLEHAIVIIAVFISKRSKQIKTTFFLYLYVYICIRLYLFSHRRHMLFFYSSTFSILFTKILLKMSKNVTVYLTLGISKCLNRTYE